MLGENEGQGTDGFVFEVLSFFFFGEFDAPNSTCN